MRMLGNSHTFSGIFKLCACIAALYSIKIGALFWQCNVRMGRTYRRHSWFFATLIGLVVTISRGVYQFASGIFNINGIAWMIYESGGSSFRAKLFGLIIIIIGTSCVSTMSGLKRVIKWLSNIYMVLSFFLISFFVIFGTLFLLHWLTCY